MCQYIEKVLKETHQTIDSRFGGGGMGRGMGRVQVKRRSFYQLLATELCCWTILQECFHFLLKWRMQNYGEKKKTRGCQGSSGKEG